MNGLTAGEIERVADVVIFIAYTAIPLQLVRIWCSNSMAKVDQYVGLCFFSFILSCGFVHLLSALSVGIAYTATAKLVCAVASLVFVAVIQLSSNQVKALLTQGTELQENVYHLDRSAAELFERNVELIRENAEILVYAEKVERDNEEMNRLAKAKSSFMAMISHEIRTPLNAIMGSVDLMTNGGVARFSDEDREYLVVIRDSGRLLLNLLNDVIDAGSIDVGNFALDDDMFKLRDLVHTTVKIIEDRAIDRRLRVDVVVDHAAPSAVTMDRRRLQQILLNTLTNAIKFTPAGGLITVRISVWSMDDLDMWRAREDVVLARTSDLAPTGVKVSSTLSPDLNLISLDAAMGESGESGEPDEPGGPGGPGGPGREQTTPDFLVLEIEDTGIGIPRDRQQDVFERFERVGTKNEKIVSGGSGLGLYITYKIVTAMGGLILLRSKEGVGSRFSILFPMASVQCDSDVCEDSDTSTNSGASHPMLSSTRVTTTSSLSGTDCSIEEALLRTFVLVAEDNKMNRMVMERMFIRLHCASNVQFVANGKDAVDVVELADEPFPLIFMDMHMPVMDGDAATRQIRTLRGRDAFIVLVSAEHVPGWRDMGFDAAILKPFTIKILKNAIYDYIHERTVRAQQLEAERERQRGQSRPREEFFVPISSPITITEPRGG